MCDVSSGLAVVLAHMRPWTVRELAAAARVCKSFNNLVDAQLTLHIRVCASTPPHIVARLLARHARTVRFLEVPSWAPAMLPRACRSWHKPLLLNLLEAIKETSAPDRPSPEDESSGDFISHSSVPRWPASRRATPRNVAQAGKR